MSGAQAFPEGRGIANPGLHLNSATCSLHCLHCARLLIQQILTQRLLAAMSCALRLALPLVDTMVPKPQSFRGRINFPTAFRVYLSGDAKYIPCPRSPAPHFQTGSLPHDAPPYSILVTRDPTPLPPKLLSLHSSWRSSLFPTSFLCSSNIH